MNGFLGAVTIAGIVGAAALLTVGMIYELWFERPVRTSTRQAATAVAERVTTSATQDGSQLKAQGGFDSLGPTLEAMAKFATAIKDLDKSTRFFLISIVFLAIGLLAASVGSITGG